MLVNITSATPAFPYYLDYIEVESTSNASSTLLPLSTGSTSRPSPSVIPSATHWSANAKSNVIISVAGALVGVLILLGLLASVFYWRHWRKLRSAKEMDIDDYETIDRLPNVGATNVVPFTLSQESTPPVAGTSSEVGTRGAPRNSESIEPSPNPVSTPTPNNAAHRLPRKKHTTGREEGYSRSATRIDNMRSLPLVQASDEPTAANRTESGSVLDSLADPPPRYTP
ncbi:hypothetical protein PHLCEN_2v9264 [Hermanssonia centrifuga]|uniref:Uncharacterized protein n=1 Tax=Hermanssonia centrifuga TaxID=98765 RepID=A0A2R6NS32_9APHY|nr:hypothetical protein PHLCEN_2v9264 [Hermanssonia centrifuga]